MNILNRLTVKHLKMNKKRTIVTIIGVVLSCALMVGIGLLFSSVRDNLIRSLTLHNGSYHAEIDNVSPDKIPLLEKNTSIGSMAYLKGIGFAPIAHFYKGEIHDSNNPYLYVVSGNKELLSTLDLIAGRLPENDHEIVISEHMKTQSGVVIGIGDKINLSIGKRYLDGEELVDTYYMEEETYKEESVREYTVVGVIKRSYYESYQIPGFNVFTLDDGIKDDMNMTVYITYKKPQDIHKKTVLVAESLGMKPLPENETAFKGVSYNEELLSLYGESSYGNMNDGFAMIIMIILVLISIGCTIVIYNSFAISVMERKKQFGLFASIGATQKQIKKTVLFEGFVVALIGIPLGVLGALIGIGTVLHIVNDLVPNMFAVSLRLSIYPMFMLIPVIYMIIVIFISAYIPARSASKITPIEAIRQNDDIKMQRRKLKTGYLVKKIFGIEGDIALKNMKRNRKKYRITIVSLFISIVLFISFSSFLQYGTRGADSFLGLPEYNISVLITNMLEDKKEDAFLKLTEISRYGEIEKATLLKDVAAFDVKIPSYRLYSKEIANMPMDKSEEEWKDGLLTVTMVLMEDTQFKNYLKESGLSQEQPILVNHYRRIDYQNGRKVYEGELFASPISELTVCNTEYREVGDSFKREYTCSGKIKNIAMSKFVPFALGGMDPSFPSTILVVNETLWNEIIKEAQMEEMIKDQIPYYQLFIKANTYKNLDKDLKELEKNNHFGTLNYTNLTESAKQGRNVILVIQILLYGFISLVTLIGVTSVFNTIQTSIALRRKEFAMLRSMGLTPLGFNKILCFESIFFGVKSLLYALPVSLGVIVLIHMAIGQMVTFQSIMIPWTQVVIAIIGVFFIVLLTMLYASHKIKRENILEAIREENI